MCLDTLVSEKFQNYVTENNKISKQLSGSICIARAEAHSIKQHHCLNWAVSIANQEILLHEAI